LYKDLEETRQRGFAISEQEYENDINAVAAPIIDVDGCPLAVIAIVGPSFRMPYPRLLEFGQAIQNTARALAGEMGLASLSVILPKVTTSRYEGHS
jgi:DNA-binding IclR family transcriptional regulator